MIASMRGPVLSSGAGWVIVGVGGLGMRVEVPSGRVSQHVIGEEIMLHTSLVVREDSLTLFGFSSEEELEVFGALIAVSGVGPRSALGVLSELNPFEIVRAVSAEDEKSFRRVSGIGPKTAKLIIVQLAGKLPELGAATGSAVDGDSQSSGDGAPAISEAVREGLVGLGWSDSEAQRAVEDAMAADAAEDHAGLLRAALTLLQRGAR